MAVRGRRGLFCVPALHDPYRAGRRIEFIGLRELQASPNDSQKDKSYSKKVRML